ncbi:Monocarboxylate transporter 10 [Myotis davidii]|uniref:Monocarboxylate transporter 10 n=1 Tax=Myotis davidii TaxID=225400 RepID=L5M2N7_MYODS|nr:Monocarboxylate transporter 10 [Myotis davidii]
MQELPPDGQCTPTGGVLLSQKPGSWLASEVAVAGASPTSVAVLRSSEPSVKVRERLVKSVDLSAKDSGEFYVGSVLTPQELIQKKQVKHVNERFKEETNKEVVLMCIGITSGVGRLLFGRIADYVPGVKKVYLQVLSFVFIGLMSMMIPLCNVFGALIAVCLIMGLFDGCFISIMAPIAFELVGAQDVSQAIGFLLGFMSIPMTVGPPIAGLLREKLGSYDVAFYLAGVPPLIGGAILCLIPWIHSKKQREINKTTAGEKMEKMLENQNSLLSSSPGILKKESDSVI